MAVDHWRSFGLRGGDSMSARRHLDEVPAFLAPTVGERLGCLQQPFVGVTTDGTVRTGFRSLDDSPATSTAPITEAALALLQALTPAQRQQATFPIDASEWRMWINVHMNHYRHGIMLEDLQQSERDLALELLRATLSARGFDQARSIMRLNELLAELTGDWDAYGEWPYFISFFGDPASGEPWGWQLDGHHLCLNAVVVDHRLVLTPLFMGAEPRRVHEGPYAGISLFDPEERRALDLMRAFDGNQRARATVWESIQPDALPPSLQNPYDGRMEAGAAHDNLVAPYQGVAGSEMTDLQRRLLRDLAAVYVGWAPEGHAGVRMAEIEAHLDETWFSWYGQTGDDEPFYYRVHSPVLLIEFDHHPGVAFANPQPTRHHVHSLVRTPNGGDYGTDLLRQHHERFEHRHGAHHERT